MLVTTTNEIPGYTYKIINSMFGLSVIAPQISNKEDIIDDNSYDYRNIFLKARDRAVLNLEQNAEKIGADAIVGMHIDSDSTVRHTEVVTAYGTAIKLINPASIYTNIQAKQKNINNKKLVNKTNSYEKKIPFGNLDTKLLFNHYKKSNNKLGLPKNKHFRN